MVGQSKEDLRMFDIDERTWYTEAQERAEWRQKWHRSLEKSTKSRLQEVEQRSATRRAARSGKQPADGDTSWQPFTYGTCKISFRRSQDIARQIYYHTPKAPLTEITSLIYHDPVYRFAAERHHLDGWPSSKVCMCVCMCVYACCVSHKVLGVSHGD